MREPEKKLTKPFVEYYRGHGISPVRQDVSDLQRHYARREALYRHLGIPALAVAGARVIEFGPGSGHNALYTASLAPKRYVLVDANPQAIREMRALFEEYAVEGPIEIVEAMLEDVPRSERFDLVLAEGLLGYAYDPQRIARIVGEFAEPGGILVITCVDAAASMGEVLRRFVARRFIEIDRPADERVARLGPIFAPHLATLHGMTRSVEDWILDNIVHPFTGKLFGIDAALEALGDEFDTYGSSPHFLVDWRWYKRLYGDRAYNERALGAFRANVVNLFDCRLALAPQDEALGTAILQRCGAIYELMQRSEIDGAEVSAELDLNLRDLAGIVEPVAPATGASLRSVRAFLSSPAPDPQLLADFAPFFGRGMQYLSLIRRRGSA